MKHPIAVFIAASFVAVVASAAPEGPRAAKAPVAPKVTPAMLTQGRTLFNTTYAFVPEADRWALAHHVTTLRGRKK